MVNLEPGVSHRRRVLSGWLLTGLAIAYSPTYVSGAFRSIGLDWGPTGPQSALVWDWIAVGALLLFILKVEHRPLNSIGFRRPRASDIGWAVAFWVVSTAISGTLVTLVPPAPNEGLETLTEMSFPVLVVLVVTTSTTEEILFRGYPIERLESAFGRTWPAVLVSSVLFVAPHLGFFGPDWIIYNGAGVVLLYVLYVWRRNLWACMTMHLLGNALLLLPGAGEIA